MYQPIYLNRFEKDLKRMQKRGKDMAKFKTVFLKLLAGEILEARYCDHSCVAILLIAVNVTLNPIGF